MKYSRRQVVETITQTRSQQADPSTVVENQTLTSFLPPPPPTTAPNPRPEQKHTDTGAVAGGVVGGVVGLALIIAAVCFCSSDGVETATNVRLMICTRRQVWEEEELIVMLECAGHSLLLAIMRPHGTRMPPFLLIQRCIRKQWVSKRIKNL